jgi:hypothetical protein
VDPKIDQHVLKALRHLNSFIPRISRDLQLVPVHPWIRRFRRYQAHPKQGIISEYVQLPAKSFDAKP